MLNGHNENCCFAMTIRGGLTTNQERSLGTMNMVDNGDLDGHHLRLDPERRQAGGRAPFVPSATM
jgi:hypothetical protein